MARSNLSIPRSCHRINARRLVFVDASKASQRPSFVSNGWRRRRSCLKSFIWKISAAWLLQLCYVDDVVALFLAPSAGFAKQ